MFTGLVETTGTVRASIRRAAGVEIEIHAGLDGVVTGDSIAVNGACLTATRVASAGFCADVSTETLRATTLGDLAAGSVVNLERAVRVGDRLGGHIVTGHVDATTTVQSVRSVGEYLEVWFALPPEHAALVAAKGSVALDGVSLTVNCVEATRFSVMLIPHTLSATNLSGLGVGRVVNFEADTVARYVARQLEVGGAGATLEDTLKKAGYA